MNIRQEIEKAVKTFAAAQSPPIPVAYEGVAFDKPSRGPYLEVLFLASNTTNPTVDGSRIRKRGIVQINCYVPDGTGMGALDTLTDAVTALFPFDQKELYTTFSVEQTPNASAAMQDAGFRWAAVRITYRQEL